MVHGDQYSMWLIFKVARPVIADSLNMAFFYFISILKRPKRNLNPVFMAKKTLETAKKSFLPFEDQLFGHDFYSFCSLAF